MTHFELQGPWLLLLAFWQFFAFSRWHHRNNNTFPNNQYCTVLKYLMPVLRLTISLYSTVLYLNKSQFTLFQYGTVTSHHRYVICAPPPTHWSVMSRHINVRSTPLFSSCSFVSEIIHEEILRSCVVMVSWWNSVNQL